MCVCGVCGACACLCACACVSKHVYVYIYIYRTATLQVNKLYLELYNHVQHKQS